MDYEMDGVEASKDLSDKTIDMEWQIDSEWINLSSTPLLPSVGNKRGKQNKHELPHAENSLPVAFHFIPASKGGKYLVIDNQPLRLSQKRDSGYSYWVCSIPCCSARCVLDPEEKKIVRICRSHNHDADISRQEYKKFINALKIAVRENPHVKPKVLYDSEIEKAKECWRQSKLKGNSNEEEPNLPTFDKAGPSRATRSKDGKAHPKRKSTPSKTAMQSNLDLDELEEEWSSEPHKDANLSDFEEWLDDDVNFNTIPPAVATKKQNKSGKKTYAREIPDSSNELHDEAHLWDGMSPIENTPRRKYRKRPASSSVFTCPHCPYKSNRHFNVQRHERLAHSTKKPEFSCKECGTSYSLEYRLKLHIKAVHQGEGQHCHICSRTFETMTGLKSHIVTKHKNEDLKVQREPPPELTCGLCGRVFSTKSHLQKHTSTHVMIQPYRCYMCNKAFMEEVTWLSHQNSCNDPFVIQCCLCSAFIPNAQELVIHMDAVHGRAEYSCHCGKIFPWKKSLLTHQQKCSLFLAERSG
ncbi:zinc finger protein with KRAB and SCAN domains 7 [Biomphalaria pfeifferi]|uniref:Zinc finger protein with KRAB and SCAN domains 7 n=1 Tax=Biomphalaria pfeifferi TaxID=112525 RepID=A0AAD8F1F2_BIOPF|nr:zinc finger protein with KRAB and SCAN domains 7 [Biomphalaria pfeifferi]